MFERQPISTVELAMDIDSMIRVLEAAKAGKPIQYRTVGDTEWRDTLASGPAWNFAFGEYRVKPEPREWWVNIYDGTPEGHVHPTRDHAERSQSVSGKRKECVRVREVLE